MNSLRLDYWFAWLGSFMRMNLNCTQRLLKTNNQVLCQDLVIWFYKANKGEGEGTTSSSDRGCISKQKPNNRASWYIPAGVTPE